MLRFRRASLLPRALMRRLTGGRPGGQGEGAGDSGFTLIEVIVAIVILTIVALSSASLLGNAIRTTTTIDQRQTAVAVATLQMEVVRGIDPGQNQYGTSRLFNGRPKSAQLALMDPSLNAAAAYASDLVANMYPDWDSTIADAAYAPVTVLVPPTGAEASIEQDGGTTVYRDATGTRVYQTNATDSFGTKIWSTLAADLNRTNPTSPLRELFLPTGTTSGTPPVPVYQSASSSETIATGVTPTGPGGSIVQSSVRGYPNGQVTLNGTSYSTTILLGTCFVPTDPTSLAQSVNGDCGRADAALVAAGEAVPSSSSPATSPALPYELSGYTKMVRVIVVVEWTQGTGCNVDAPCHYMLTSEFLPNVKDLLWNP